MLSVEHQDTVLKTLVYFLLKFQGVADNNYFSASERMVYLAFLIRNDPEKFAEFLIN